MEYQSFSMSEMVEQLIYMHYLHQSSKVIHLIYYSIITCVLHWLEDTITYCYQWFTVCLFVSERALREKCVLVTSCFRVDSSVLWTHVVVMIFVPFLKKIWFPYVYFKLWSVTDDFIVADLGYWLDVLHHHYVT